MMLVAIYQLELNATPYDERGWCQAETQWAALRAGLKEGNAFPVPPAMFRAQMSQLKFTHRDDADNVFKLQAKIFQKKASSTTRLLVEGLDADKFAVLIAALPFYSKLKEVVASSSPEYAWKLASAVVQSGASKIQIECNSAVADGDAITLAADLSSEACCHLEVLHLKCNALGELGLNALQEMRNHRQEVSAASFDLVIQALDRGQDCIGHEVEPQPCVTLRILISQRERLDHSEPVALATQVEAVASKSEGKQKVTVHCLKGATFCLDVDTAETGFDVASRIAARTGYAYAAESLMLSSGDCVLDPRNLLLQQAPDHEITYVVRKLGAGFAARALQRVQAGQTLNDADACAMAEIVALTFSLNHSMERMQLPANLQTLTFGPEFNQSLESVQFPANLQTLTFGHDFNQSLESVQFPANLETLTFGPEFNQRLERVQLPTNLQTLTFGLRFNQSLESVQLPANLQTRTFGPDFDQSLENVQFPANLETLTFGPGFNQSLERVQLPAALQTLTFGPEFNQSLERVQLPENLHTLTFGYDFNQSLESAQLPATLQTMTFGLEFDQSLESVQLPANLQTLSFGHEFHQSLENVQLPTNLQALTFGNELNQSLESIQFPANLQNMTLEGKFNQSLKGVQLPANLQTLTFGPEFNQSLERVQLPATLQTLTFGNEFNQSLERVQLPALDLWL